MATTWTYTHPAIAVAAVRRDSASVAAAAPATAKWAAQLAADMRDTFAQKAAAHGSRIGTISFSASTDDQGDLTITMSTTP